MGKEFTIRQATKADFAAIDKINRSSGCWDGEITSHELLEKRYGKIDGLDWVQQMTKAVAEHIRKPGVVCFAAEVDGKIVGYAAGEKKKTRQIELGEVSYNAVLPEYRGRRIGRELVKGVMRNLRDSGARILYVVTIDKDQPAAGMYEKLGFEKLTSHRYYTIDCKDIP